MGSLRPIEFTCYTLQQSVDHGRFRVVSWTLPSRITRRAGGLGGFDAATFRPIGSAANRSSQTSIATARARILRRLRRRGYHDLGKGWVGCSQGRSGGRTAQREAIPELDGGVSVRRLQSSRQLFDIHGGRHCSGRGRRRHGGGATSPLRPPFSRHWRHAVHGLLLRVPLDLLLRASVFIFWVDIGIANQVLPGQATNGGA